MIKTKGLATTIEFARSANNGTVVVSSHCTHMDYWLTIQEVKKPRIKVGDLIKDKDIKPLPSVTMELFTEESVDVLIKHLERIKEAMQRHKWEFSYCAAC